MIKDDMKKNKRIAVTLAFLITIVVILGGAALYGYEKKRQECFDSLVGYTEQIARQIRDEIEVDREYLTRFATQLSESDLSDTASVAREMSTHGYFGMLSRLELLLPDDQVLLDTGRIRAAGEAISFDELKDKEEFVSRRASDLEEPEKLVIHHCVPVKKNGQVAAILCGVIDLSEMPELFYIYDYGDDYNVFVMEAGTGNFIQDTWHDTLSSFDALGTREAKRGYDWQGFHESMTNLQPDTVVFMSKSAGAYFYSYGAPVGVEDWIVMVNVLEPVAFAQAYQLMKIFFTAAALLLLVFAIYFVWSLKDARRENVMKERQLKNVSYMLNVEKLLFDAHIYPEHFVLALKCVAEYLSAETAFLWLTEGENEEGKRCWFYGRDFFQTDCNFNVVYPDAFNYMEKNKEILIQDKDMLISQFQSEGEKILDEQVHSLMAIPVQDVDGKTIFVLGACNIRHHWDDCEPLRQVALSFSMTVNHFEAYQTLQKMGTTDAMTGVNNRNSYHREIDAMNTKKPEALGCIYIDINGLHEINNYLGHQAGDKMLRTVADILKKWFYGAKIFRIGGDEFVVFCEDWTQQRMNEALVNARTEMKILKYELSVGIVWAEGDYRINKVIETAEEKMREDKALFYSNGGKARSLRQLNEQMERMVLEKADAEAFISSLEPEFKGVYFVNLDTGECRHLFMPDYFQEILDSVDGDFSKAILEYADRYVVKEDSEDFKKMADFDWLKGQLDKDALENLIYRKKDGTAMTLRIVKFNEDEKNQYKTQWIFKVLI